MSSIELDNMSSANLFFNIYRVLENLAGYLFLSKNLILIYLYPKTPRENHYELKKTNSSTWKKKNKYKMD